MLIKTDIGPITIVRPHLTVDTKLAWFPYIIGPS